MIYNSNYTEKLRNDFGKYKNSRQLLLLCFLSLLSSYKKWLKRNDLPYGDIEIKIIYKRFHKHETKGFLIFRFIWMSSSFLFTSIYILVRMLNLCLSVLTLYKEELMVANPPIPEYVNVSRREISPTNSYGKKQEIVFFSTFGETPHH